MLKILGDRLGPYCDQMHRRSFLRLGGLGCVGGLTLADLLAAESGRPSDQTRSVIMVYLCGGPTQHETFDPKPDAPSEIRGSYNPIKTRLPGIPFCELLPKLAGMNDRFSVIRSLTGMKNRHESFQCYSGRPGGRPEDAEPAGGWPTFGAVASQVLGPGGGGALPYVDASPAMSYRPYRNRGIHLNSNKDSWPGFTGMSHVPFAAAGEINKDLVLNGVNLDRFASRQDLLGTLSKVQRQVEVAGVDTFQQQALGILTSSRMANALDLEQEDKKTREWYGEATATDSAFGAPPQSPQHLLMARRLVEAGVRCVTVAFGAWDWHSNREGTIEYLSKRYLPPFDHAISVLLEDLEQRGLSERVSVVVWGEFGRTPKINAKGGRDHWDRTQSILLAGGNIRSGQVIGTTDKTGGVPVDRPVHVQEVFATIYQQLGIDVNEVKINDLSGRPRYLVDENRQPVKELN